MEVKVTRYEMQRVKNDDLFVHIPDTPIFFQEYNHRVIIGIFPQRLSNGEIYDLQIVRVNNEGTLRVGLPVHRSTLERIILTMGATGKSQEDYLRSKVVNYLIEHPNEDRVSLDIFIRKYEQVKHDIDYLINKINE